MTGLGGDVRYALRTLTRTPAFTLVSVVTLAAGLGMGAAAFSAIDTLLLKPLRFRSPEQLVLVHATVPPDARDTNELTFLDASDLARETQAFTSLGVVIPYAGTATSLDPPERIEGYELSPSLFETLGAQPALGRAFTTAEGQSGPPTVVILGDGFWRQLGARRDIIGQTLVLDEVPHTVVGVMPADFHVEVFNGRAAVYRPVTPQHFAAGNRNFRAFRAIARLQPGVSIEQAQSIAATVGERLAGEYPETNRGRTFSLQPLQADLVGPVRPALLLMAGLVALVLLIAAVNLMNLLLARAIARAREVAVRSALGAGAWRLARTSLIEGVLLAVAGAVGGVFVAQAIADRADHDAGSRVAKIERGHHRLAKRVCVGRRITGGIDRRRDHSISRSSTAARHGDAEDRTRNCRTARKPRAIGDGRRANRSRISAHRGHDPARREPPAAVIHSFRLRCRRRDDASVGAGGEVSHSRRHRAFLH